MIRTSAAFLVLLVLDSSRMCAQGSIHGFVSDSLTQDQLAGAEITLAGTPWSSVSSTDGEFHIPAVPPGEYVLLASYLGYEAKKYLINMPIDETVNLHVELVPSLTVDDGVPFTPQARSQAEQINGQVRSSTITNVVPGKKLQEMPDESVLTAVRRLSAVSILHRPVTFSALPGGEIWGGEDALGILMPPQGAFSAAEFPVSRVLIRGLDFSLSSISVDGVRIVPTSSQDRSVDLGILSERELQNIQVYKTVTADQDADATAGGIHIITGKAPPARVIVAELLGNYNGFSRTGGQYDFDGRYGERFLGNSLGIRADGHADKKNLSNEYQDRLALFAPSHKLAYTNAVRTRAGGNVVVDYPTPDGGSIRLNTLYEKAHTECFESSVDSTSIYPTASFRDAEPQEALLLSSIGGSNYVLGLDIAWKAAFSESQADRPYDYTLTFSGPMNLPGFPTLETPSHLDYTLDRPSRYYGKETTLALDIHKRYGLSNDIAGEIQCGGKRRIHSRSYDERLRAETGSVLDTYRYRRLADGAFVMKDFAGTRFDGLVGASKRQVVLSYFQDNPPGTRVLFDDFEIPLINNDASRLWRQLNYSEYYSQGGPDINSYEFSRSVLAGYVMHTLNFGQAASFITGVRIESEHNDFRGYYFPLFLTNPADLYNGTPRPSTVHHYDKVSLLPNVQIVLRPADFLNLRVGAYKTLIRPDINARLPRMFAAHVDGISINGADAGNYLDMGNPDLKNADVWNYEIQTQFYGTDIGQLSINAFYKDIDGMVQPMNGIRLWGAGSIDSLGIHWSSLPIKYPFRINSSYVLYTYYQSSRPTRIWGFEIEHQANVRYLPGLLKNIVLNYSFTFLRSETWTLVASPIATSTTQTSLSYGKQALDNMPEFLAHVVLGYDIAGFSLRLSYCYEGEYPLSLSFLDYPSLQAKENRKARLDIAAQQQILDNISVILNLNNITNSKEEALYKFSYGKTWKTLQAFRYGMNFDFGVRVKI